MKGNGTSIMISSPCVLSFYEFLTIGFSRTPKGEVFKFTFCWLVFIFKWVVTFISCLSGMFSVHWDEVQIILDDLSYDLWCTPKREVAHPKKGGNFDCNLYDTTSWTRKKIIIIYSAATGIPETVRLLSYIKVGNFYRNFSLNYRGNILAHFFSEG